MEMDRRTPSESDEALAVDSGPDPRPYRFSKDWFTAKIPIWERFIGDRRGRPGVHYLEIGTHEGRSFFWMLDNILTHSTSRAVVIDPFSSTYAETFDHNLTVSGAADRVTVIQGAGELEAKKLPEDSFDIIYVDGGHAAQTVFAQAAISWQLLKTGGVLIFDDYRWRKGKWPIDLRPEIVIDTFLTAYSQELELLDRELHILVRKVKGSGKSNRSKFFDKYAYGWSKRQLFTIAEREEIELDESEREFIERYLRSLRYSEVKPELTEDMIQDPAFIRLWKRLKLKL